MSDIFADYSFGGWLRRFRLKRKITLREMSRILKTDPSNYCKLETSELSPPSSREKIDALTRALNLEKGESDMLLSTAFQHHLSKLKERFK